jgi:hypothetical protein
MQSGGRAPALHTSVKLRCITRDPAARAIRNNPAPTTTAATARATRSPAGARCSTVMAAATTAIARRSMTPMTSRIAISEKGSDPFFAPSPTALVTLDVINE